ncbi:serpin-type proteinase inhibitor 11 [Vairimorpha necatrix]|uniref:Serpin-type proteinase inhibitor 11 n=1 Tax=Vairimorpha necatrix TaxID=6039 RepID=A0AAX4JI65_9MICR
MIQKIEKMFEIETTEFQMVQLSCSIKNLSFVAVLPKKYNLKDIHNLILKNSRGALFNIMLKTKKHFVSLKIPKFKVESKVDIIKEMKTDAVKKVLRNNQQFLILSNKFLESQNDYEHVAMVDINEEREKKSKNFYKTKKIKEVIFNRPFLFYVIKHVRLDNYSHLNSFIPCLMGRYTGNEN